MWMIGRQVTPLTATRGKAGLETKLNPVTSTIAMFSELVYKMFLRCYFSFFLLQLRHLRDIHAEMFIQQIIGNESRPGLVLNYGFGCHSCGGYHVEVIE